MAVSLSGPEVRPHVLWQAGGLAWLRGNAARAEELTTEAYELFRRVTPHARHAYAAHQFTLRRADHREAAALPLLVETGDEGNPLLQEMAVLAAAESGDVAEARRLRARWGRTLVRDWASDVAVYLQAESSLWLGDEPDWACAAESLLPYRGRQAVLGTPALTLGAYDELLGRIAERRGDLDGARRWWRGARAGRAGRLAAPGGAGRVAPRPRPAPGPRRAPPPREPRSARSGRLNGAVTSSRLSGWWRCRRRPG